MLCLPLKGADGATVITCGSLFFLLFFCYKGRIMDIATYLSFVMYAITGGWSPGPNNVLLLASAGQFGARPLRPLILGIWSGLITVMLLCGFGCSTLGALLPGIVPYAKYVGAAYILYLAYLTVRRQPPAEGAENADVGERPLGYRDGFMLQFLNIKVLMLGIAAFSGFVLPLGDYSPFTVILFAVTMAAGAGSGNLIWTFTGHALMPFCRRHWTAFNAIMGLMLLWCAGKILFM